jgi:hypothetical protein
MKSIRTMQSSTTIMSIWMQLLLTVVILLVVLTDNIVLGQDDNDVVPVATPVMRPSAAGRQTIGPSYSTQCLICNTSDMIFANESQIVTVANRTTNCSDLFFGGFLALIPPAGCPLAKQAGCDCIKMPNASSSDQPSISLSPSISMSPSYMDSTSVVPSMVPSPDDLTPPPVNVAPMTPIASPVDVPVFVPTAITPPTTPTAPASTASTKYTMISSLSIIFTILCGTIGMAIAL